MASSRARRTFPGGARGAYPLRRPAPPSTGRGANEKAGVAAGPHRRPSRKGSEEAFLHGHDVARQDRLVATDLDALIARAAPLHEEAVLLGAVGETARQRHGVEHRHAVHVGVGAGILDLAEDVERPVVLDLDADLRVDEEAVLVLLDDALLQLARGQAAGLDLADQRHGEVAGTVEGELP